MATKPRPRSKYTYEYPRPALTVDIVLFGVTYDHLNFPELQVLLVERGDNPFRGKLALPGGFVNVSDEGDQGESLEEAARRELREETNVRVAYLEQLCTMGTPGRDPRGRVIDVAYFALVQADDHEAKPGSDAREAFWHNIDDAMGVGLAFDHGKILDIALRRLRAKIRYAPIGFDLLPPKFTLRELQDVYEAILGRPLDAGNFRRSLKRMNEKAGIIVRAGIKVRPSPAPVAQLWKFDRKAYDKAAREGFSFEL